MADYPRVELDNNPPRPGEYVIIWLSEDERITIHIHDVKTIYTALAGLFAGVELNAHAWNGLTTVDKDGTEVIQGWYGSFSVAQTVARKQVDSGKTKGARAYACIGEYGTYKDERPPVANPDGDGPEDAPEDAQQPETLDRWL